MKSAVTPFPVPFAQQLRDVWTGRDGGSRATTGAVEGDSNVPVRIIHHPLLAVVLHDHSNNTYIKVDHC